MVDLIRFEYSCFLYCRGRPYCFQLFVVEVRIIQATGYETARLKAAV